MDKRQPIILLLILVQSLCFAQQVSIGKEVPDYTFRNMVNDDPQAIAVQDLRGKMVIINFWATWCSSCIPEMHKLDSLQKQYKDVLKIIAVSTEHRDRLKKFADATKTSLTLVSDNNHRDIFPYKTISHAILIDKKGIVRAITAPHHINSQTIAALLEDNVVDVALKDDFAVDTTVYVSETIKQIANSDYRIALGRYDPAKSLGISLKKNFNGVVNGIAISNSSLPRLYMSLFDITMNRLVFKDGLTPDDFPYEKKNLYNFSVEVSDEYVETWKDLSVDFLNSNLRYRIKQSVDSLVCFELKDTGKILKSVGTSGNNEFSYGGGNFKANNTALKYLVEYIEGFTGIPVLDKTNLEGFFDINLNWQLEDPKTIHSELKKYGLVLESSATRVPVEVIHVYRN